MRTVSRRQFLHLVSLTGAGAVVAACTPSQPPLPQAQPAATQAAPTSAPAAAAAGVEKPAAYKESPALAELVKAGKLPPVEQRLPAEPLVVKTLSIGQYGGNYRGVHTDPANFEGWLGLSIEGILEVGLDGTTIMPGIAKSYTLSDDGKEFTIKLREGMKWSDGEPFTADDIMFWYEDVILNDELMPSKPTFWSPGGELMKMTKVDDYTLKMVFAVPYFRIVKELAYFQGTEPASYPKHWMKQFHPKYADKAKLEQMIKDQGFQTWMQLFNRWGGWVGVTTGFRVKDPHIPSIHDFWVRSNDRGNMVLEPNPYYWKVDPEGNQLPYADTLTYTIVQNPEAVKLKIIAGEVDFEGLHTILQDYPLYKQNSEAGKYNVLLWNNDFAGNIAIMFNQTHKDPDKRKIFSDVRFRRAMSIAIDRDEMNKVIWLGKAVMQNVVSYPGTVYYDEKVAKAWTQFDLDTANKMLDELGLDKRDADGFRQLPNGKTLDITFEFWDGQGYRTPVELVCDQWRNGVHVKVTPKAEERNLWSEHTQANDHDVSCWSAQTGSEIFAENYSGYSAPVGGESVFGIPWVKWYQSDGKDKDAEEPPAEAKKQMERHRAIQTASPEETIRLVKEINQSQADNLWAIGTAGLAPMPVICSKRLQNLPEKLDNYGWDWMFTRITHPESWYIKE